MPMLNYFLYIWCGIITERHIFYEDLTSDIQLRVGRDSAVGIGTRYGLDGPEIESRWGARFSTIVLTGPGAHPASYKVGTGSLSRG